MKAIEPQPITRRWCLDFTPDTSVILDAKYFLLIRNYTVLPLVTWFDRNNTRLTFGRKHMVTSSSYSAMSVRIIEAKDIPLVPAPLGYTTSSI